MLPTTEAVHILVVDDDEVDRELIERSLRKARIANPITMAEDGRAALDLLRGSGGQPAFPRPNIVLLDWNMPRMNGNEFLEEVRRDERLRSSIVFVLTTSRADSDIAQAYAKQVAGYIVKDSVGADFANLVTLLDAYWRIVELPA